MPHDRHTVSVFAPLLTLTITIEAERDGLPDVHIHPGGQGFWVSRMLRHLGERPLLCSPIGGEVGKKLEEIGKDLGLPPVPSGLSLPPLPKLDIKIEPSPGGTKKDLAAPAPSR